MGTEIKNTKIILLSAVIITSFFIAFLVVAVIEREETKKESAVTVSGPQKLPQKSSGQIAGVTGGPTIVNITSLDNSSNKT